MRKYYQSEQNTNSKYSYKNTIIIDDSAYKLMDDPGNLLLLPSYSVSQENCQEDTALLSVLDYLKYISTEFQKDEESSVIQLMKRLPLFQDSSKTSTKDSTTCTSIPVKIVKGEVDQSKSDTSTTNLNKRNKVSEKVKSDAQLAYELLISSGRLEEKIQSDKDTPVKVTNPLVNSSRIKKDDDASEGTVYIDTNLKVIKRFKITELKRQGIPKWRNEILASIDGL